MFLDDNISKYRNNKFIQLLRLAAFLSHQLPFTAQIIPFAPHSRSITHSSQCHQP